MNEEQNQNNEREVVKISRQDKLLLDQAKRRDTKLEKENRVAQRESEIGFSRIKIRNMERVVEHKQGQIQSGELSEVCKDFIDERKPVFWLENEIDEIQFRISEERKKISRMEQLQAEEEVK